MNNIKTFIKLLGTRGSFPCSGKEYMIYGQDTSCIYVNFSGKSLFLDLGSGLAHSADYTFPVEVPIPVLLSHPHLDHVMGIVSWSHIYREDANIHIYAVPRGGLSCKSQIEAIFSKPLWPLELDNIESNVKFIDIVKPSFMIDDIRVDWVESNHPGGSSIFKLSCNEKSIVYITDFEHSPKASAVLEEFLKGANIMLYDAQFTDDEYLKCKGWGHSTWREGLELARRANVKRLVLIHHDPKRTDTQIQEIQLEIDNLRKTAKQNGIIYPPCTFGKAKEEIVI